MAISSPVDTTIDDIQMSINVEDFCMDDIVANIHEPINYCTTRVNDIHEPINDIEDTDELVAMDTHDESSAVESGTAIDREPGLAERTENSKPVNAKIPNMTSIKEHQNTKSKSPAPLPQTSSLVTKSTVAIGNDEDDGAVAMTTPKRCRRRKRIIDDDNNSVGASAKERKRKKSIEVQCILLHIRTCTCNMLHCDGYIYYSCAL